MVEPTNRVKEDFHKRERIAIVQREADAGVPRAQTALGLMLLTGLQAQKDAPSAVSWIRKAAEQGYLPALRILGLCYLNGEGVHSDEEEAAKLLLSAANQGDAEAQNELGEMFEEGQGVQQSYTDAVRFYNLAAEQNNSIAQYNLARMYHNGWGVQQNLGKAIKLAQLAADNEHIDAQRFLGELWENGWLDGTDWNWSNKKAAKWYKKAAERGDAESQYRLGRLYYRGAFPLGVAIIQEEFDDADLWLRQLEDMQSPSQDSYPNEFPYAVASEAMNWLRAAADQNHSGALRFLSDLYAHGDGVPQSNDEALLLLRRSAELGDIDAQLCLNETYRFGRGVEIDKAEADRWLDAAAQASPWGVLAKGIAVSSRQELFQAAQLLFAMHRDFDFKGLGIPFRSQNRFDKPLKDLSENGVRVALLLQGLINGIRGNYGAEMKSALIDAERQGDPLAAYYLAELAIRGLIDNVSQISASRYLERCIKSLRHVSDLRKVMNKTKSAAKTGFDDRYDQDFELWLLNAARSLNTSLKVSLAKEETHKRTLSFLTHTLNNTLSTGPETVRTVIEILGSDLYDQGQEQYKAINNMASLLQVLVFAENLLKTFKLYVSDPEQLREKWDSDRSGDATVSLVVAMALRQSIARFVFSPNHQGQLKRLLPGQDKGAIKQVRKSFVEEMIPLEISVETAGKVFDWVKAHFGMLQVEIAADAEMRFSSNATRYMFFFAAFSELVYNSLKYSDGARPIQLKWFRDGSDYCFTCVNSCPVGAGTQSTQEGSNGGLFFIDKLMSMLRESALSYAHEDGEYRALLRFDHNNFGAQDG